MKLITIMLGLLTLILITPFVAGPGANAFEIHELVHIKPNNSAVGYYNLTTSVWLDHLIINETHASFLFIDENDRVVKDADTDEVLCNNLENCTLPQIDYVRNITFSAPSAATTFEVWNGAAWVDADIADLPMYICGGYPGPGEGCTDNNVVPEGQNDTQSIYKLTNSGNSGGTGYMNLTGMFTNITYFCDDDNSYTGAVTLTNTTKHNVCGVIDTSDSCNVWCWVNFTTFYPPAEDEQVQAEIS